MFWRNHARQPRTEAEATPGIASIAALQAGCEPTLDALIAALRFADRLGARLEVIHFVREPHTLVPLFAGPWRAHSAAAIADYADREASRLVRSAQDRAAAAWRSAKTGEAGPADGLRFRTATGPAAAVIRQCAASSDLLVIGRFDGDCHGDWRALKDAALALAGKPVLVLPAAPPRTIGSAVAILWDGSFEAARAARAARPVLARSQRVVLLTAREAPLLDIPLPRLEDWISAQAPRAEIRSITSNARPTGKRWLDEAERSGADLVIAGAHPAIRMDDLEFEDTMQEFVDDATLPLFMTG